MVISCTASASRHIRVPATRVPYVRNPWATCRFISRCLMPSWQQSGITYLPSTRTRSSPSYATIVGLVVRSPSISCITSVSIVPAVHTTRAWLSFCGSCRFHRPSNKAVFTFSFHLFLLPDLLDVAPAWFDCVFFIHPIAPPSQCTFLTGDLGGT